jgi:hypothetical protein
MGSVENSSKFRLYLEENSEQQKANQAYKRKD